MKKTSKPSKRGSKKKKIVKPPIQITSLESLIPVEQITLGQASKETALDMLFVRDNLVSSLDPAKLYSATEVTDYVDQGINGVLKVVHDQCEPWALTVGICQAYFDLINS